MGQIGWENHYEIGLALGQNYEARLKNGQNEWTDEEFIQEVISLPDFAGNETPPSPEFLTALKNQVIDDYNKRQKARSNVFFMGK